MAAAEPDFDVAVVGAGVVGLAIAAEAAARGRSVAVLERHDSFGRETSSRNSEVIHAGLYYPPDFLKTKLCVEGRRELYRICEENGIGCRKCGKLVVAVEKDEVPGLAALLRHGTAAGVEGLCMLSAAEVGRHEPNVLAVAGLHSPESGIIDSHGLMEHFRRRAEAGGGDTVFGCEVTGLERTGDLWEVRYRDAEEEGAVSCRAAVNAAGLGAQEIMRMAGLDPEAMNLSLYLCKGEYFSVQGPKRVLVSSLVYPTPEHDLKGLGIHTVVDLGGGLKLGPSAEYVDEINYDVDSGHRDAFLEDARSFLPQFEAEDLVPDMSGIRPKLCGPGEAERDFHIAHEAEAGAPGFFNLAGIESPGLTAAPAIGRYVADLLDEYL
ncbi:MAG: NAD(P)/FAD-dependent oxidoreductase [Planctomycetota bacterium]|jgi:L-2-hydroxyglutarate oxidase LhgO